MFTPVALALSLFAAPSPDVKLDQAPVFTEQTRTLAAPNRVLVKFRDGGARLSALAMGFKVLSDIPKIGYSVLLTPYGKVDASLTALRAAGLVTQAQADHVYFPAYTPNDPLFPDQWNLYDQMIPQAWDMQKGNKGLPIAVLDTGVDYTHPELAPNLWKNKYEIAGDGIDNDGNGYVDDTIGWDFGYGDNDPRDDHGHGTACAGINAAVQDNEYQLSGIAPRCTIMPVKISRSDGYSYDSMFAPAVIYAATNGARVMSISFFGDDITPALRAAADYAYEAGALMVVAAGNFNSVIPLYPAAYDHSIAVAAHVPGDTKASFSNFGTWVDVSAPGVSVTATTMGGGYTTGFGGTSAAAPNAAGVVALLRSSNVFEGPDQIRHRLEYATDAMTPVTEGEVCNYGRVNAYAALGGLAPLRKLTKPEIRYIAPVSLPAEGGTVVIRGRVFQPDGNPPIVLLGSQPLVVVSATDKRLEALVPPGSVSGNLVVRAGQDSKPVALSIGAPGDAGQTGPSDIQFTNGSRAWGGPKNTWYDDGKTVRGLGPAFTFDALFRGLNKDTVSQLKMSIKLTAPSLPAGATCTVSMYDFSSGSYPYGGYSVISNFHPALGSSTVTVDVSAPVSRFVSYEGDLYVRYVANLSDPAAYLDIDRFWFEFK